MKKRNTLLALLFLTVSCLTEAIAANARCEPQLLAEARLKVTDSGEVLLPVRLNGRDVYFRLWIGSGLLSVSESAVGLLGLKPMARIGGAVMVWDGKKVTDYARLEDMTIGDFRLATRNAPILPVRDAETTPEEDGRPIVGIMGSTLFQTTDAELNLGERQLKLFRQFRCVKGSPISWGGEVAILPMRFDAAGTLVFTLELEGRKIEASLLQGGRETRIDSEAARQFFGVDTDEPYHPMSLTGPGLQIDNAKVLLTRQSGCRPTKLAASFGAIGYAGCVNDVPFDLGSELLSQLRIYIASGREKVYVSRAASASGSTGSPGTLIINPDR